MAHCLPRRPKQPASHFHGRGFDFDGVGLDPPHGLMDLLVPFLWPRRDGSRRVGSRGFQFLPDVHAQSKAGLGYRSGLEAVVTGSGVVVQCPRGDPTSTSGGVVGIFANSKQCPRPCGCR